MGVSMMSRGSIAYLVAKYSMYDNFYKHYKREYIYYAADDFSPRYELGLSQGKQFKSSNNKKRW